MSGWSTCRSKASGKRGTPHAYVIAPDEPWKAGVLQVSRRDPVMRTFSAVQGGTTGSGSAMKAWKDDSRIHTPGRRAFPHALSLTSEAQLVTPSCTGPSGV